MYNPLESQRLFRQVENGNYKMLPGSELVTMLADQLREADKLIQEQQRELTTETVLRGRHMPAAAPAPIELAPARPSAEGEASNPFLAGARQEAPAPIPFDQTPGGLSVAPAIEAKAKRARKKAAQ